MKDDDDLFMRVIAAVARHRRQMTPDEVEAIKRENHRNNPLHKKAVARRRKRKRGGPK